MEKDMSSLALAIISEVMCGCQDSADGDEGLADQYWDDWRVLADMVGDKIYSEVKGDRDKFLRLATVVQSCSGHKPLIKACDYLIREWDT